MKIYGYARISTSHQNIQRQIRNIKAIYSDAVIIEEEYSGMKIERPKFNRLLANVKAEDTIVFDAVSRMSRNSAEGVELYKELFNKGINLVFLKEPHINTETYKSAINTQIDLVGDDVDFILKGINEYLLKLAEKQIIIAFDQSEKEVLDLRRRTAEGIETAKINGKQIGRTKGDKLVTKKSIKAKEDILKHSNTFNGSLKDIDLMKLTGLSRNTFYKYKKELLEQL